RARFTATAARTNPATFTTTDQSHQTPRNATPSATEPPQQADLAVNKTVSNPTPNVGDVFTYTIRVTNSGPDAATGVTLQDTLPAGVLFLSASPGQGSYNSTTGVWTVGTVAARATATLTLTVRATSPNPQANTASLSHSDQFDPNPANNSDAASVNPQQADLSLVKVVSNARPNVGDTVTFTVTLTNNGPSGASAV